MPVLACYDSARPHVELWRPDPDPEKAALSNGDESKKKCDVRLMDDCQNIVVLAA